VHLTKNILSVSNPCANDTEEDVYQGSCPPPASYERAYLVITAWEVENQLDLNDDGNGSLADRIPHGCAGATISQHGRRKP
jgi:hypothetical protein